jgi:hypothetical protein
MVQLIPGNANPTRAEIDAFIRESRMTYDGMTALKHVVREIECKSGVGALLHPAEEYFVTCYAALLTE